MKRCRRIVGGLAVLLIAGIAAANLMVSSCARYTFDHISRLPPAYCAILLGTSKWLRGGRRNLYYHYRIMAAAELYRSGRCRKIIVSGDNGTEQYNEPLTMKRDLVRLGVNKEDVVCDYAGFRTLDSILRFKKVFGQENGIVVSQKFHNTRAVYIARAHGIDLVGYNARDVSAWCGLKTRLRELLSKAVCVLDVEILHTEPKYLGERIPI